MPTIVIRLEPVKEVTKTESEGLNLSIIPIHNLNLIGALPCSLTPGFKEAYLTTNQVSWQTQGISIWAEAKTEQHASFDLELYKSELIGGGLQIRVSVHTGEIEPVSLYFPPGSLPTTGVRLHINIGQFMQRIENAQKRSPHLFQQEYQQHLNRTSEVLAQQNHQPLSKNQRATSDLPSRPNSIRSAEQQLNRERESHLKHSSLF